MVTGFTSGKMVIDMKGAGSTVSNMAKEQIFLLWVMSTPDNTLLENLMDMVHISGRTAARTLENSKKAINMVKEIGRRKRVGIVTDLKGCTCLIRKMVKALSHGRAEMSI